MDDHALSGVVLGNKLSIDATKERRSEGWLFAETTNILNAWQDNSARRSSSRFAFPLR